VRFLVDECAGPAVAEDLRAQNHDVTSVFDALRGTDDLTLLEKAVAEERILITADKGFGEKVYRQRLAHRGIVLLRLEDQRPVTQNAVLRRLLRQYADDLPDQFVVVNENSVRFAEKQVASKES
jgi:predicted nuclease of predicted toxin-antitoxin system